MEDRCTISIMQTDDLDAALTLWRATPGIGLHDDSDSPEALRAYLRRNPDLSVVARDSAGQLVGAVLCGHDGRRGYLHHLAVAEPMRSRGIARALVAECLNGLRRRGIPKCNAFVISSNTDGRAFWQRLGWVERDDLELAQKSTGGEGE